MDGVGFVQLLGALLVLSDGWLLATDLVLSRALPLLECEWSGRLKLRSEEMKRRSDGALLQSCVRWIECDRASTSKSQPCLTDEALSIE